MNEEERAELEAADRTGDPFLEVRDGDDRLHVIPLGRTQRRFTIGRRSEADVALSWDPEVSRLHAELNKLAGEWTITDDGLSQNGTYVNEIRLEGRRRLAEGDLVRVGRTSFIFHDPRTDAGRLTMLPGEMTAATRLSEQQHHVLRELCRPLVAEGMAMDAASDEQISERLGIPAEHVAIEVEALVRALGFDDIPAGEARIELAMAALQAGLVRHEDFAA